MDFRGIKFRIRDWQTTEQMVYWVIWSVILFLPLVFWDFGDYAQRRHIIGGWMRIFPFLVIFIIHNQLLLPKLLLKNKQLAYFISTILLILLINYLFIYNTYFHDLLYTIFGGIDTDREKIREGVGKFSEFQGKRGRPGMRQGHGGHHRRWHTPEYLIYTYNVIISILIVGFNATLKYTSRWLKEEQKRREIEKDSLQSQLKSLQHQVSPHFFMNTLNNIHALIDYNQKDAKEAVLRLSQMMRYLLYDSEKGKTTLRKEIDFLNSYIDLMRLRINETVQLKVSFPEIVPDIIVYPHLFISFVENAFKYGIGYEGASFIHVLIEIADDKVHFNVKNSKPEIKPDNGDYSGIGIENAKKRLDLLFGENYVLAVYDRDHDFEVDLLFPYEN
ncbi:hypothetical protein ES705_21721 [subsurface metagenome]